MNMIGKMKNLFLVKNKIIFLSFLFLFTHISLSSQTIVVATVDRTQIPINESFTLSISVSGDNASDAIPDLSSLSDFNVYSSGKSSNISIVNGHINSSVEFIYTLTPRRTGRFTIPRIGVSVGSDKYWTKEITIDVIAPNISNQQPNQRAKNQSQKQSNRSISRDELIFVTAETDKKSAYVGEQINLTIKFYTAMPISSNPQYLPPSYTNLISDDLPPVKTGTEIINGIRYYYAEIKTALFGIMSGKATVSPATIVAYTQEEDDVALDPFDPNFIQKFFSATARTKEIKLQTKPLTLDIKALPPPPSDFTNAVGNFFITAKVDNQTVNMGDPLNLTVEVTGKGNVNSINAPTLNSPDFKVYDILNSQSISKNKDVIGGTKKFTYIITPLKEGNITIDSIKMTFFNIDTKRYETITTNPIRITVLKAKDGGKTYDFDKTLPQNNITQKNIDINYIYEKTGNNFLISLLNKLEKIYLPFDLFLILALIVNYIIIIRRKKIEDNPVDYNYKKAINILKESIKKAEKEFPSNSRAALSLLYDSIYDYISRKLKQNIAHLPFEKIANTIKVIKPSFSDELIKDFKVIIERIEFLNYTSSKIEKNDFDTLIKSIIDAAEKAEKEFLK